MVSRGGRAPVVPPRAGERPVLDPVRLERIGATRFRDRVGVFAPGALEPRHLRVAFEREDVRGDAVEEPAIVGEITTAQAANSNNASSRARSVSTSRPLVGSSS